MALLRNTFVVAAMLVGTSAFADSISPEVYEATLAKGESVTIKKTVTVSAGRPSSSKVDVFFLSDTTGSMGGIINSVRTNASTILADTAGLGDVNWGVGSYKDTGDVYTYREEQALTDDTTDVQAGINTWGASGGGDFPEGNQIALREVRRRSPDALARGQRSRDRGSARCQQRDPHHRWSERSALRIWRRDCQLGGHRSRGNRWRLLQHRIQPRFHDC